MSPVHTPSSESVLSSLSAYTQSAADWRRQLRRNDRRTKLVIAAFVLIYLFVGFIIDLYLHPEISHLPLSTAIYLFATFKIPPIATMIFSGVALISILITYALYDRIIFLGTNYHEITAQTSASLAEKQLYNVIEELKIAAGMRYMPRVFIIEADYMNAFASGYSEKSALVAITRGLLEKLERDELQAVMAHELNHIKHHDIKLTLMATVLSNIMLIAIDVLFYSMLFGGRRERRRDDDNRLFFLIMLLRYLLPLLTVILMLYLSRTREYMADAGAVELTRDNAPLAKALLKISRDHEAHQQEYTQAYRSNGHEEVRRAAYIFDPSQAGISIQQSVGAMFSTHPPLQERLQALGFKLNNK